MKKFLFITILSISFFQAYNCDICGCFNGITPYDNQSSFSFNYRYRVFNGYSVLNQNHLWFPQYAQVSLANIGNTSTISQAQMHATDVPDEYDYEIFNVFDLRARFFIHQRIEINGMLPYYFSAQQHNDVPEKLNGIGDAQLSINYHLIHKIETEGWQQRLIVGGGIKLPTGNYQLLAADGDQFELPMQPGTGSIDGIISSNYTVGKNAFGASTSVLYKLNGENKNQIGFANSFNCSLNVFYKIVPVTNWKLIPALKVTYEKCNGEKAQGILTNEHFTENIMSGGGFELFHKNISLNADVAMPVYENGSIDHPANAFLFNCGLIWHFNQRNYLLK